MKKELETRYRRIREEERAALQRRTETALRVVPSLRDVLDRRSDCVKAVGTGGISASEGRRILEETKREQSRLLREAGLPEDSLELRFRCAVCRDTGVTPTGELCACALRIGLDLTGTVNDRETFENFREDIYPDERQKNASLAARRLCMEYADSLPDPARRNLLIRGGCGLGKSYLVNAIACRALSRGVGTELVTAYRFAQDILSDIRHGTENAERFRSVPLFILDDLGCEPEIRNVSREWLFAVINERMLRRLCTVVVTNLDYETIGERYGDRLLSRLVNASETTALRLTGRDLRTLGC